jgi:GNAT superfamily N-acetyltransferase
MPTLQDFPHHEMPPQIATQIRSYVRMQWPFLNAGNTQIWDYAPQTIPSHHFVLMDGELLVSHASVNQRDIPHHGRSWRVGGLSTVFTYPDHRGTGCASRVVAAATKYLQESDADIALLFAGHHLEKFYHHLGWVPAPDAHILFGSIETPELKSDNLVMALLISPAACERAEWFVKEGFYIGESTW